MKPVTLHLNTVAMRNTGHVGCSELIVLLFLNKRYDDRMRLIHRSCKSKVVVQGALDEARLLFDSLMQKYFG